MMICSNPGPGPGPRVSELGDKLQIVYTEKALLRACKFHPRPRGRKRREVRYVDVLFF